MIGSLRGTVSKLWLDGFLLDVGGVGFRAFAAPRFLTELRVGGEAQVAISMVVREDALTLFAFPDDDEREVFDIVRSVSGIGPKTALALLAVHSADEVRQAINDGDVKAIQRVPGIGPKTAQRVILELGGKLVPVVSGSAKAGGAKVDRNRAQVIEALAGLGYLPKTAEGAVAEVLETQGKQTIADDEVAEVLRLALRSFGAKR